MASHLVDWRFGTSINAWADNIFRLLNGLPGFTYVSFILAIQ